MKENIKIDKLEVDGATYIREDLINKESGTGLFRDYKFCGLDWQVIGEDAEKVKLLAKTCLSPDIIKQIFNSNEYDSDYDVRFNTDPSQWRWRDSIIRKRLNDKFLKMLDKDSLVQMTTEVWLDGESSITKDYVRLLTDDEIKRLPKSIKANKSKYWYWSLSPYSFNGSSAGVFIVITGGDLTNAYVRHTTGGVAPVITVKRSVLTESTH